MAESRSLSVLQDFEELLECSLCTEIAQHPRLFPCHHWYCQACVAKLIQKSKWPSRFYCPNCREEIPVPTEGAAGFPAAFHVTQWADAIKKQKAARPKLQSKCQTHQEPYIKVYCKPCQQRLCGSCVLQHEGHRKVPIEDIRKQRQKQLKDNKATMMNIIHDYKRDMNDVDEVIKSYKHEGHTKQQRLRKHGNSIINFINTTMDKMESQIEEEVTNAVQKCTTMKDEMTTKLSKFVQAVSEMEEALNDDELDFNTEVKQYEDLLKERDVRHKIPEMSLTLNLIDTSKLTEESLVGSVQCKLQTSSRSPTLSSDVEAKVKAPEVPVSNKVLPPTLCIKKLQQFDLSYGPYGATCSPDGEIVVCGERDEVNTYSREGRHTSTIQLRQLVSSNVSVWDVAATQEKLYITEYNASNGCIFVYDKNSKKVTSESVKVGYKGNAGIALSDLYIYVTSSRENIVYRLDREGRNKHTFIDQDLSNPQFIATSSNSVAVSSYKSHQVSVYDSAGQRLYVYGGGWGRGPGQLYRPQGVVFDKWGRLLITDYNNHMVCIVSPQGQHEGDIMLGKEGLRYPRGVALTEDGQLIVACGSSGYYDTVLAIYQYCN